MTDSETDTTSKPTALGQLADEHGLVDLARVPPLREYLRQIWDRRAYAVEVPKADFRARNLHTVLGQIWHLLNPGLQMAVYYIFFGLILGTDRGVDNFLVYLGAGVFAFGFTSRSAIGGAGAIVGNLGLIRAIKFPRAILPLSVTISQVLAYLPMIVVLCLLALGTGEVPNARWLLIIPLTALQAVLNFGLALLTARIAEVFRDLQNLLPFVFRMLFYMSGVLYAVENYVTDERLVKLFAINPLYSYITALRYAFLDIPATGWIWVSIAVYTPAVLLLGLWVFKRAEATYGRA